MTTQSNPFEISNRVFTILVVFLVGLVTFWGFRVYEIYNAATGNYPREISVEGIGKAYITPDVAKITLGVNTKGKTSESTLAENTKKINAMMDALAALGIAKEDIKTTGYYLNPNYEYTDIKGSYQDGYILDQTIEVSVKDFAITGDVISKTATAGANMVGGINFTTDDKETAKAEARADAIKNAKAKAEQIADQTNLKLGKVVSFYEYENYTGDYGKGGGGIEMMAAESVAPQPPTIEPGKQELSLTVTLGYKVY